MNPQTNKTFSPWQARYAICGHTLYRIVNPDGAILYLAARWGMVRELATLGDVAKFYALIGGKL